MSVIAAVSHFLSFSYWRPLSVSWWTVAGWVVLLSHFPLFGTDSTLSLGGWCCFHLLQTEEEKAPPPKEEGEGTSHTKQAGGDEKKAPPPKTRRWVSTTTQTEEGRGGRRKKAPPIHPCQTQTHTKYQTFTLTPTTPPRHATPQHCTPPQDTTHTPHTTQYYKWCLCYHAGQIYYMT